MFPLDSKVLIIDDSNTTRTMLKSVLRDLNYWKIMETPEAKLAKDLFFEDEQKMDPVHLIFLDLHMPEVSGFAFLKWLREQPRLKTTPVIIVTSSQEKTEILEAAKMGVSHYIVKPFKPVTIREKIDSIWQKQGQAFLLSLRTAAG